MFFRSVTPLVAVLVTIGGLEAGFRLFAFDGREQQRTKKAHPCAFF